MLKLFLKSVTPFINAQTLDGVLLAAVALILSNSAWSEAYLKLLAFPIELRLGGDWLVLTKPLLVWINDLWMAVFFFLVGLEIKRELRVGELASKAQALLPAGAGADLCGHQQP